MFAFSSNFQMIFTIAIHLKDVINMMGAHKTTAISKNIILSKSKYDSKTRC